MDKFESYVDDTIRVFNRNFDTVNKNFSVFDDRTHDICEFTKKLEDKQTKINKKVAFWSFTTLAVGYILYAHMRTIDQKIDEIQRKIDISEEKVEE